ncbi:hypothetical protein [Nocardiopsis alba]|uniref:hypothetical protein n=1 Tax=Nocardiopsis alba TaxID=53437 RepID=UPI003D749719
MSHHGLDHVMVPELGRSDVLVAEISRLLASPGRATRAVRELRRVDGLFSELDRRMRAGAPPPRAWRVFGCDRGAPPVFRRGIAYDYATDCYESMSEALRRGPGTAQAWKTLAEVERCWRRLNDALTERSPLPEPWLRE